MRLFYKICIDAPYDLILVFIKKGQGVINIIRIKTVRKDRFMIIEVLSYGSTFRCGIQKAPEDQEFCKAVNIILKFGKSLVGREEGVKAELFQDSFQKYMRKKSGMSHARRASFSYLCRIGFVSLFFFTVW